MSYLLDRAKFLKHSYKLKTILKSLITFLNERKKIDTDLDRETSTVQLRYITDELQNGPSAYQRKIDAVVF